jgi:hypothetical protein
LNHNLKDTLGYASTNTDVDRPDPPMQRFADKVGFVPSLRGRDNAVSAIGGAVGAGLFIAAGLFLGTPLPGLIVMGVLGFVLGVFVAGVVLAVLLLFRSRR